MNKYRLLFVLSVLIVETTYPYSIAIRNDTDSSKRIEIKLCTCKSCPPGLKGTVLDTFEFTLENREVKIGRIPARAKFLTAQVGVLSAPTTVQNFAFPSPPQFIPTGPLRYPKVASKSPNVLNLNKQDLEVIITDERGRIRFEIIPRV